MKYSDKRQISYFLIQSPYFSIGKLILQLGTRATIQDVLGCQPALASHLYSEPDIAQPADVVSIWVDAHRDPLVACEAAEAPVEVQSIRAGVDLH